ncbi:hypothetical protein RN001_001874 [Aquatica leii]|uniref:Uncharacterized protein n=1 Tax=Aquatica leii TaxID=1421715 RepID=A0AAN7QN47_9COLE|nr:hypothetical protein RN001_001874 [Aquatica leii]
MSKRSKRILKLALQENHNEEEKEDIEPTYSDRDFSINGDSDSSYVPPSDDDYSDDMNIFNLGIDEYNENATLNTQSPENRITTPIVVFSNSLNTATENTMAITHENNTDYNNYGSVDVEFEDNNNIEKLNGFLPQNKAALPLNKINSSLNKSNKNQDIFKSSFLIKNKYKKTVCKFCDDEVISKHFARHLERKHTEEKEVKEILSFEVKSKERKKLLLLLRNAGNLELAIRGHIIPKKRLSIQEVQENDYAICIYCKGYYKRLCLSRHMKKCFAKTSESNTGNYKRPLAESLVYSASQKQYGDILNKLAVKQLIFSKMQADIITSTAMNDILLILFGEDLLKKTKNKRSLYHISNKLRECSKFLLQMKQLGSYSDMLSTLKPEHFDNAIQATKNMSRYDVENRTFGAASLALHFGTTLKKLAELAEKLILRKKISLSVLNVEIRLTELERFKK